MTIAASPAPDRHAGEEFGVVIPAKPEHLHWARGTCASIRYFMGDTPICLLLDGGRSQTPSELVATYGVQVICRDDVEQTELRGFFGSLRVKGAAHWLSPFETFLLVDADTVVWGDMRSLADFERFDYIVDEPIGDLDEVRKSVMDADAVTAAFPDFDARAHVHQFVNTGAYFARRGIIELDRYLEFLTFARAHPRLVYGDQGPFNFMVFGAADAERVRVAQRELQVLTGRTTRPELERRFAFADGSPVVGGDPVALHWVGSPKPRVREGSGDYFEPMTFFRRRFRAELRGGKPRATDVSALRLEDVLCTDFRGSNLRGRWSAVKRRSHRRYRQGKAHVRARTPDRLVELVRRRPSSRTGG